ncbi:hypothetical protein ANN_05963 [Periplaneta americana]|uniref:Uncharacterized protein n=1 Tax=Periplaneta americana TaxID=6978 RepID=A0ABQ8TD58_PERAM|nr:hypothetical protein ANN_05963 [Periplaneta americana]
MTDLCESGNEPAGSLKTIITIELESDCGMLKGNRENPEKAFRNLLATNATRYRQDSNLDLQSSETGVNPRLMTEDVIKEHEPFQALITVGAHH